MGKIVSPENRRKLLRIGYLNIVKIESADGAQLIVIGLKVAWKNLDSKDLPSFVFNANIIEGIVTQIPRTALIGGKHGVRRIRPIVFTAYHIGIPDCNIRNITLDPCAHFKGGGVVQFP